jgi:hypothetical protein
MKTGSIWMLFGNIPRRFRRDGLHLSMSLTIIFIQMQFHAGRARSDDTGKLKRDMDKLLANPSSRRVKIWSKSSMGWYDKDTARLLCPLDDLWEFDQDKETCMAYSLIFFFDNSSFFGRYMDNVLSGNSKHWSEWSTFLYDEELLDDDDDTAGLFRSPLLVRVRMFYYSLDHF